MSGGTYTLIVELVEPATLSVGALGERDLGAGAYAYVGSALGSGGFSRVDRHRRVAAGEHDVRHWHVDYLLGHPAARLREVVRTRGRDVECAVAERLPRGPIDGFGSSDCDCRSHLAAAPAGDDESGVDAEGDCDPARVDALVERVRRAHAAVGGAETG